MNKIQAMIEADYEDASKALQEFIEGKQTLRVPADEKTDSDLRIGKVLDAAANAREEVKALVADRDSWRRTAEKLEREKLDLYAKLDKAVAALEEAVEETKRYALHADNARYRYNEKLAVFREYFKYKDAYWEYRKRAAENQHNQICSAASEMYENAEAAVRKALGESQ